VAVTLTIVPAASAAPLPRACTLLTKAQVKHALGSDVLFSRHQGNRLWQMCTWQGEALHPSRPTYRNVSLTVTRGTKARFLGARRQNRSWQPVRGVGELAYYVENLHLLAVWQDGLNLEIVVSYLPKPLASAKGVATAALGHL
jgi:hypothetical protein